MASLKMEFMVENIKNKEELKKNLLMQPEISRVEIVGKDAVVVESTLSCDATCKLLKDATNGTAILWGFGDSSAAVAVVEGSGIKGVVRFGTSKDKGSLIDGTIDGLPLASHFLQIHVAGDISQGCQSLGSVLEPYGKLGNIKVDENGRSNFKFYLPDLEVGNIVGRSIAVANKNDQIRYLSISLFACGIIARSAGLFQNNKRICACDGVTLWDEHYLPAAGSARQHQTRSDNQPSTKIR